MEQAEKEVNTMAREKEGFREQLARLDEKFPGRECITLQEACDLLGFYRRTLLNDKTFPRKMIGTAYAIPMVGLARWLCP